MPSPPAAGGSRELLALALPLVISQSFVTVQVFLDTLLLAWHDPTATEMAASFPGAMWFWVLISMPQATAGYASTFVAQYTGAGKPERVGPAVWQAVFFAVAAGAVFVLAAPLAPAMIALGGHTPALQEQEAAYLRCLLYAAPGLLVVAAVNGFFSGRGHTWTVLGIDAFGTGVNVALAQLFIFGRFGLPEMGIAGAGWATVGGSVASALLGLALFLRRRDREAFATLSGARPDADLIRRLFRYGGFAGLQMFLDALVFLLFTLFVGRLGEGAMGATTLAIRLNMFAFLPMLGLGQAVTILVGQRLGAGRADLAERSTFTGLNWSLGYAAGVGAVYVLLPGTLVELFVDGGGEGAAADVAAAVPTLLMCVAAYSLADAVNISFASALRGAGDTRFVSLLTFVLAWPMMVLPTYLIAREGGTLLAAWGTATAYIVAMAGCFWWRFAAGRWKRMRVIEGDPAQAPPVDRPMPTA